MKISGSISIVKPADSLRKILWTKGLVVAVSINGEVRYYISKFPAKLFQHHGKIVLFDADYKVVRQWFFKYRRFRLVLPFREGDLSEYYQLGILGRRIIVNGCEEVPAYFRLQGGKRVFSYKAFKYSHYDYQSVCHFTAPENDLESAILVGSIIFNIPLLED